MKAIRFALLGCVLCGWLSAVSGAQGTMASTPAAGPIQDNSFLVEEAYNQEPGVIQHITTMQRMWTDKSWITTFTQEWPWPGKWRHQLSYTIVGLNPGSEIGAGIGDTLLNYRYQVLGNGESKVAFAPRLSLVIPSGDSRQLRGYGGGGIQTNLPLSVVVTRQWVTHWNVSATAIPSTANLAGQHAATTSYTLGQSVVWLANSRFNILCETVWNRSQFVVGEHATQDSHSMFLNPGIRWAHNFRSGLQIVPGVAVPVGVGPSAGDHGIFLYLSFEHPLWKDRE
jgi:hypothetical protein